MPQIAVFVDAGYLYAQGSTLLKGTRVGRESIRLSIKEVLDKFEKTSCSVASDCRLLRIYWYDGLLRGNRPSMEQDLIGQSENAKLRLGLVNSRGQQKGVDSLIVTDLIELARNRAITDALILSGDEDIKIGVQVAQTFGVRIHLLGIKPARGSQSDNLMMEADTCHEWDETIVGEWMQFDEQETDMPLQSSTGDLESENAPASESPPTHNDFRTTAFNEVKRTVKALSAADLDRHVQFLDNNRQRIHSDIDRPTLASIRNRLNRDLTRTECNEFRQIFADELRTARAGVLPSEEQ